MKKTLYLLCPHEYVILFSCEQFGALHLNECDEFISFIGYLDPQNIVLLFTLIVSSKDLLKPNVPRIK